MRPTRTPSPAPRRAVWLAVCSTVVGACVLVRVRAVLRHGPSDFDDAYMFLRYANNLLAGHGMVWNPGEAPVHGVTSFLHLAVVTVMRAAWPHAEAGRLLQAASAGAGILAVAFAAVTCGRFARGRAGLSGSAGDLYRAHSPLIHYSGWAAGLFLLITLTEPFELHARTGMDTLLSLLANVGVAFATLALAERPSPRRAAAAAIAGYLAILARPDNAIAAALCPVLALLLLCPPPRRAPLAVFVATLAGLVGTDLTARAHFLGTALPLAFHTKQPRFYAGFAGEYTWNPFWFLRVFLAAALPFVVVLLTLVGRARWRLAVVLVGPVVPTVAFLFSINQIMGHLGRFYYPMLAYLAVAAALLLEQWRTARRSMSVPTAGRHLAVRLAVAAVAVLGGAAGLDRAGHTYQARARTQRLANVVSGFEIDASEPLPDLDSWEASKEMAGLAARAPAGTVFAMSEHGLVGAFAPRAIIVDVLGLHDRVFALEGWSAGELWQRRPDLLWLPHPDHTRMVRDILDSEELWSHYDFFPDAFTYGVALRRDSQRWPALHALFEERWRAVYPGRRPEDHLGRRVFF